MKSVFLLLSLEDPFLTNLIFGISACPLPVLHKENCTAGKLSRKVWRIIYILRKNDESGKVACEQEKEYLYEEPCRK